MGHLQVGGGGYIYHRGAPRQGSKSILLNNVILFGAIIKTTINRLNLVSKYQKGITAFLAEKPEKFFSFFLLK
jgi:hypothetical protein